MIYFIIILYIIFGFIGGCICFTYFQTEYSDIREYKYDDAMVSIIIMLFGPIGYCTSVLMVFSDKNVKVNVYKHLIVPFSKKSKLQAGIL